LVCDGSHGASTAAGDGGVREAARGEGGDGVFALGEGGRARGVELGRDGDADEDEAVAQVGDARSRGAAGEDFRDGHGEKIREPSELCKAARAAAVEQIRPMGFGGVIL
jgi:hypothetical protein